jgi:hypothetical protein
LHDDGRECAQVCEGKGLFELPVCAARRNFYPHLDLEREEVVKAVECSNILANSLTPLRNIFRVDLPFSVSGVGFKELYKVCLAALIIILLNHPDVVQPTAHDSGTNFFIGKSA